MDRLTNFTMLSYFIQCIVVAAEFDSVSPTGKMERFFGTCTVRENVLQ
jgi:hypothetical protein